MILNIAGNRGSKISKEDLNKYRKILKQALIEVIKWQKIKYRE